MTKILKKWEIIGFIFVVALGSVGHFLYEWTGQNALVGKFFAVNESTWEHLKLLFFPYAIFTVIEWFYVGKSYLGFVFAKLIGAVCGMVTIVVLFYTYTGVIGKSVDILNILIFVVGTAVAFYVSYRLLSSPLMKTTFKLVSLAGFLITSLLFVVFTNNPPRINLFKDPVTNQYGAENISDTTAYTCYKTTII